MLLPCIQCRVHTDEQIENRIKLGSIGYAWCFPLSDGLYHIGCGSFIADPRRIMEKLGWLSNNSYQPGRGILCECEGNTPHRSIVLAAICNRRCGRRGLGRGRSYWLCSAPRRGWCCPRNEKRTDFNGSMRRS